MRWAFWLCSARQEPISSRDSLEVKSCLASHPWSKVASRMCRWLSQSFSSARHLHAVVLSLPRLFSASAGSWPFPLAAGLALYTASPFLAVIRRVSGGSCCSPVSAGTSAALAQGELQRGLYCLDPHKGPESVCGVCAQVCGGEPGLER